MTPEIPVRALKKRRRSSSDDHSMNENSIINQATKRSKSGLIDDEAFEDTASGFNNNNDDDDDDDKEEDDEEEEDDDDEEEDDDDEDEDDDDTSFDRNIFDDDDEEVDDDDEDEDDDDTFFDRNTFAQYPNSVRCEKCHSNDLTQDGVNGTEDYNKLLKKIKDLESIICTGLKNGTTAMLKNINEKRPISNISKEDKIECIDKLTFMENVKDLINKVRLDVSQNRDVIRGLVMESLKRVMNVMKLNCNLDVESYLLNIGSGHGITSFHAAYDPGVMLSVGIDNDLKYHGIAESSMQVLSNQLQGNATLSCKNVASKCYFIHNSVNMCSTFNPFTHIFMQDQT